MDDLTKAELDQLLGVFRDQSLQILDEMGHDLLTLESSRDDAEAMTRLRRGAHTLKGDSACIDLEGVTQIAHKIEDVFDAVLIGKITFDRRSVDVILKSLDSVKAAIDGAEVGDVPAETANEMVEALAAIQNRNEARLATPFSDDTERRRRQVPEAAIGEESKLSGKHRRDYVRVEAAKIDALLNLAGEMVIARSVIGQLGPEIEMALPRNEIVGRFSGANTHMGKLIAELQKSVLKMRMVTIDHVFRRFARPMRELAAERGKLVELHMSGGETELDRALVDLLYEPLLHLLRNAVDHGLETSEVRRNAGKPEAGRIGMRAYHEGNYVVIEVSDDGRGIDPAAVKERAIEAGAITSQDASRMPDEEAAELIFLEGLSTARNNHANIRTRHWSLCCEGRHRAVARQRGRQE